MKMKKCFWIGIIILIGMILGIYFLLEYRHSLKPIEGKERLSAADSLTPDQKKKLWAEYERSLKRQKQMASPISKAQVKSAKGGKNVPYSPLQEFPTIEKFKAFMNHVIERFQACAQPTPQQKKERAKIINEIKKGNTAIDVKDIEKPDMDEVERNHLDKKASLQFIRKEFRLRNFSSGLDYFIYAWENCPEFQTNLKQGKRSLFYRLLAAALRQPDYWLAMVEKMEETSDPYAMLILYRFLSQTDLDGVTPVEFTPEFVSRILQVYRQSTDPIIQSRILDRLLTEVSGPDNQDIKVFDTLQHPKKAGSALNVSLTKKKIFLEKDIDDVIQLIEQESNEDNQIALIRSLGGMRGEPKVEDYLKTLVLSKDKSQGVREAALETLRPMSLTPDSMDFIRTLLNGNDLNPFSLLASQEKIIPTFAFIDNTTKEEGITYFHQLDIAPVIQSPIGIDYYNLLKQTLHSEKDNFIKAEVLSQILQYPYAETVSIAQQTIEEEKDPAKRRSLLEQTVWIDKGVLEPQMEEMLKELFQKDPDSSPAETAFSALLYFRVKRAKNLEEVKSQLGDIVPLLQLTKDKYIKEGISGTLRAAFINNGRAVSDDQLKDILHILLPQ